MLSAPDTSNPPYNVHDPFLLQSSSSFYGVHPDTVLVKDWRRKLQRAFFGKSAPKPEDMPEYDQLFTTIENYEITIEQLTYSKLRKIMWHITQLDQNIIPDEDKFSIRKRARVLYDKWREVIAAAGEAGTNVANVSTTVNGTNGTEEDAEDVQGVTEALVALDLK